MHPEQTDRQTDSKLNIRNYHGADENILTQENEISIAEYNKSQTDICQRFMQVTIVRSQASLRS